MAPWSQIVMWLGEPVVLPNQLVGTVILVGDGSRPLSDRGYVPVVVMYFDTDLEWNSTSIYLDALSLFDS